jgi:transposase
MTIIGCDFHPSFQQIAYVEQETGEYEERRLSHRGEAEAFYRSLAGRAVRIGMEATGNDRWFHKLMGELGHELLVGDASAIHASAPREQRTDKRDARHILSGSCCCIAAGWCACGRGSKISWIRSPRARD